MSARDTGADTKVLCWYDLPVPGRRPGRFEERYWSLVTAPVLGPDGQVVLIISQVRDVTGLVRSRVALDNGETLSRAETMTAALLARSRALQKRNESLRLIYRPRFHLPFKGHARASRGPITATWPSGPTSSSAARSCSCGTT